MVIHPISPLYDKDSRMLILGSFPSVKSREEGFFYHKALDKLEALIQHNESPIDTWSENEYELNKTYAFNVVEDSDWLMELRKEILKDTLEKIDNRKR